MEKQSPEGSKAGARGFITISPTVPVLEETKPASSEKIPVKAPAEPLEALLQTARVVKSTEAPAQTSAVATHPIQVSDEAFQETLVHSRTQSDKTTAETSETFFQCIEKSIMSHKLHIEPTKVQELINTIVENVIRFFKNNPDFSFRELIHPAAEAPTQSSEAHLQTVENVAQPTQAPRSAQATFVSGTGEAIEPHQDDETSKFSAQSSETPVQSVEENISQEIPEVAEDVSHRIGEAGPPYNQPSETLVQPVEENISREIPEVTEDVSHRIGEAEPPYNQPSETPVQPVEENICQEVPEVTEDVPHRIGVTGPPYLMISKNLRKRKDAALHLRTVQK